MQKSKYSSSFTAGALLLKEFQSIAEVIDHPDLREILTKEKQENQFLRIKTEQARKRVISEMRRRLKSTPEEQWSLFKLLPEKEQRIFLFYAILNAQPLAKDFHFEVVVNRWLMLMRDLSSDNLRMRLSEIESEDEVVHNWSDTTKSKLITQFQKILSEVGMLKSGRIEKIEMPADFWKLFIKWDASWFLEACLLTPKEINALK